MNTGILKRGTVIAARCCGEELLTLLLHERIEAHEWRDTLISGGMTSKGCGLSQAEVQRVSVYSRVSDHIKALAPPPLPPSSEMWLSCPLSIIST